MQKSRNIVRKDKRRKNQFVRCQWEMLEPRFAFSHNGEVAIVPIGDNLAAIGQPDERISINPFAPNFSYTTQANGLPILNSYPAAPAAIYFDVTGYSGLNWGGVQTYDFDGNPASYSLEEQHAIVENWRELAGYYAMFNVNVTTIKPSASTPTAWVIWGANPTTDAGISNVNVFPNSSTGGPLSLAGSGFQYRIADTLAHEVGHNFGSWHIGSYDAQGNATAEYATAHDPLHGPIMGNGPSGVIEKWILGHSVLGASQDAARLQDDMAEIANDLDAIDGSGDGYRPDDYGGTLATATQLQTSGTTQSATGIIERLTDADAFKFTSAGGRYSIVVGRDFPSGVDVKVSVYSSAGVLISAVDGDPRKVPYTMVNDANLTLDLASGTYYIVVESHGNYGDQGQYVVRVDPLAGQWKNQDVGVNRVPGYSSYNAATGTYTVAGSGVDIWGSNDGFQYLYQTLTGDGEVIVKVASMEATADWAKAGIMIRDSLADNAKEAYVVATPKNGVQWSWRTSTGGSTGATTPNTGTNFTPTWLRLVRSGNTFTAYRSNSTNLPTTWTKIGATQTVSMGATVYVGLATSSVYNEVLNQATYTNLSITGNLNVGPTLNALPAPTAVSVGSPTSNTLNISWSGITLAGDTDGNHVINAADLTNIKSNFGNAGLGDVNGDGVVDLADYNFVKANLGKTFQGYAVERSSDGVTFTQIGATSASLTNYIDNTGLADAQRYFYRVRTIDSAGVSAPSSAASGITRAGAVSELRVISYAANQLVIDWVDASGESSYRIERSDNGTSGWTQVGTVGKNVPLFVNSGLTVGTKYYYRVVTIDANGDSATSAVANGFTRLAAVTGLQFTAKTASQMAIAWSAVANATGYKIERSSDNATWSTVSANQPGLTYTDNAVTPVQKYYYRVTALNATAGGTPATIFAASPAAAALPSPWSTIDVNINDSNGGRSGAAGLSGSTLTMVGGGADIWGTSDQFRFTYVTMTGNGSITARVVSIDNTDYYARAGVMIRNTSTGTSTAAGSKFAAVMVHQSDAGVRYQYRTSTSGGTNETVFGGATEAAPYWVRLTRTGNSFLAEASTNGTTWSTIGTQSFTTNTTVLVGLALTPRNNDYLNRAVFDNVTIVTTSGTITLGGAGAANSAADGQAAAAGSSATSTSSAAIASAAAASKPAVNNPKQKTALHPDNLTSSAAAKHHHAKHTAMIDLALVNWRSDARDRKLSQAAVHALELELSHWRK